MPKYSRRVGNMIWSRFEAFNSMFEGLFIEFKWLVECSGRLGGIFVILLF